jgi:hypothetical protein
MLLAVVRWIVVPLVGTLTGNDADVESPAGRVPRLRVGMALVPLVPAWMVIGNVTPAFTVTVDGEKAK